MRLTARSRPLLPVAGRPDTELRSSTGRRFGPETTIRFRTKHVAESCRRGLRSLKRDVICPHPPSTVGRAVAATAMMLFAGIVPAHAQLTSPSASTGAATAPPVDRPVYDVPTFDFGLPPLDRPGSRSTPQGTLELFVDRAEAEDWTAAAHALNLSLVSDLTTPRAAELARKLDTVIRAEVSLDWSAAPDTPDGTIPRETGRTIARRTVNLGAADLGDRSIPVNLQRFEGPDGERRWLFSPFTVAHVDALYERHGPGWLERQIPRSWRRVQLGPVALLELAAIVLFLLVGVAVGWLIAAIAHAFRNRSRGYLRDGLDAAAVPLGLTSGVITAYILTTNLVSLTGPVVSSADTVLFAALLLVAAWLVIRVVGRLSDTARRRYQGSLSETSYRGRQLKTQLSVAQKAFLAIAAVIVLGIALSSFPGLGSLSISLLASAGVLTLLIGIAAQPLLGNLIAGIQIAATEPVQIGDMIKWGDGFGWVEDITFTYVVMRVWNQRRLIIPHSEILSKTFENWSKNDESMTREIWLYVDPLTDIDGVRRHFEQVVEADERWDGKVRQVAVLGMSETALHLRCLVSADEPSKSWYLHLDLRETMVKFLQGEHHGRAFRRERILHHRGLDETAPSAEDGAPDSWQEGPRER